MKILVLLISIFSLSAVAAGDDGFTAKLKSAMSLNFKNVEITTLQSADLYGAQDLSHAQNFMDLSFILFRNTGWTHDQLLEHLKAIARIYNSETCQIFIRQAFIIEADPYQGILDVDWASVYTLPNIKGVDLEISSQFPQSLPRPALVLIRSVLYPVDGAYSAAAFKAGDNPSYVNSSWIPMAINAPEYKKQLPPGYDPVAHELAHLLGNTGHNTLDAPNILNDEYSKINDQILPAQCTAFKQSSMVSH